MKAIDKKEKGVDSLFQPRKLQGAVHLSNNSVAL